MTATAHKVFCSGATGYIGGAILRALAGEGIAAVGGLRAAAPLPPGIIPFITGDLSNPGLRLPPVEAVIHAAGLGHKRRVSAKTWRRTNLDAAVNLARAARAAGASRFILISTAHIHGRAHNRPVTDTTPPNPQGAYAESKLQAEHEVAAAFGPGLSIIRPVAVIGPGCPGNIALLLKLLARGIPLPFAAIENQRSFIHRDDLARIVLAVLRSATPPESVLAAHPEAISTPELIRALAEGLGVERKLFACSPQLLKFAAALLGRAESWQSLAGNFIANPAAARQLGWKPEESLIDSLRQTARYHNTTHPTP
ncbi:UDP-glucose 4-epimerase [Acidocella aquatica]|uniref:UDP-glucose 4-epimerase n=1 Tax=Acidocella aquatica TaxID=1922313 RepID=A0ABQ6A9F9_9PROT|nr:NAD-dependent epimerase/dehydratase family protein [Acidocella aquatica]GLR67917.1 UDP-glucose 4-epimerase [Acidocella aquatica]